MHQKDTGGKAQMTLLENKHWYTAPRHQRENLWMCKEDNWLSIFARSNNRRFGRVKFYTGQEIERWEETNEKGWKLLWNHMDLLDVFLVIFYPTDVFLWINLLRQFLTKSTLASKVKKARRKIFKFYGHLFMTTSQVSSNSFVSFSKLQTWTL